MFKINAKIKGVAPLMQHRFSEEETKGKKKQVIYDKVADAEKAAHKDEKGYFVPSTWIEGAMLKASVQFKLTGRKTCYEAFKGGVFVDEPKIRLSNKTYTIDYRPVVVNRGRIMRSRPLFEDWNLEFSITATDDRISPETVKDALEYAGQYVGIGDFRPRYGRFALTEFEVIK